MYSVSSGGVCVGRLGRLALRKVLHRRRRNGACMHEVRAVGTEDAVANLTTHTRRATHNGWTVTAACTPSGTGTDGRRSILTCLSSVTWTRWQRSRPTADTVWSQLP